MAVFCECGQLATHGIAWNRWTEATEIVSQTTRPSRCLACARRDAALDSQLRQAHIERAKTFYGGPRFVYRTDVQLPLPWIKLAKKVVRRRGEVINPDGLVELFVKDKYLFVELYPPKGSTTWKPENSLYLLRYLANLPLVFVPVQPDESPSPVTWRESRKPLTDTANLPLLLTESTRPDGSNDPQA